MNSKILGFITIIVILGLTKARNVPLPKEEIKRPDQEDIIHSEQKMLSANEVLLSPELELIRKVRGNNNGYYKKGGHKSGGKKYGGYYKGGHSNGYYKKGGHGNGGYYRG